MYFFVYKHMYFYVEFSCLIISRESAFMLNLVHVLYLVVPQSLQPKNKLSLANYHKALDPNQKFNAQQPANTCITKQKAIIDKKRSTIKVCSIFTLQFGISDILMLPLFDN